MRTKKANTRSGRAMAIASLIGVVTLALLGGCRDQAKLDACKTDATALATGDGCKACCSAAGSQNFSYMNIAKASCECK